VETNTESIKVTKKDFLYRFPTDKIPGYRINDLARHLTRINELRGIDYYFRHEYKKDVYGFVFNTGNITCSVTQLNFGEFKIFFDIEKVLQAHRHGMFVTGGNIDFNYANNKERCSHYNIYKMSHENPHRKELLLCLGGVAHHVRDALVKKHDIGLCVEIIIDMLQKATIKDGLGRFFKVNRCEMCDDVILKDKVCNVCKELA